MQLPSSPFPLAAQPRHTGLRSFCCFVSSRLGAISSLLSWHLLQRLLDAPETKISYQHEGGLRAAAEGVEAVLVRVHVVAACCPG
jgi:hypothetical protein